jgi:hypothetical protein
MLAKMRDSLPTIWRQIHALRIPWLPGLTAEELTKLTWAKAIESYDDIPHVYRDFFEPLIEDGRAFPYTVLTPSFDGFLSQSTEKLVCALGSEIYILERSGKTFRAQCYPLAEISYIEIRSVLLDSNIKICGATRQGAAASILKFNSVTDYLLIPILKRIRLVGADPKGAVLSSELQKFDQWYRLNYKFMNYAKRSLLGGDKVIRAILQPEIQVPILTVLGKTFYRTLSPTHVSILTNRELIMIREEIVQSSNSKYGGTWDYIPLNKIIMLSLHEKDGNLLALSIRILESDPLEFLFRDSAKQELERLLQEFKELTAG